MERPTDGSQTHTVAGLIVGDGDGRYYAFGWADLEAHRVPATWVAAVAAVVHGAEPTADGDGVLGHAATSLRSAERALISEAIGDPGRLRLTAQRVEAWALLP